jgi:RNA polymerase sigma-70 factor (ECF subfamily)
MKSGEGQEIQVTLQRLQQDGQAALAEIFSENRDRLRRMIELRLDNRLRGRVSTSDILQEAYIDALTRLRHYEANPEVPFFVWLRTVTIQRLIQVHRQHLGAQARDAAKEVRLGFGETVGASTDKMVEIIQDLTSPSQAADRGEMMARLREAIERLDPMHREILALRHFEELANHEVASLLGIQPAAASKRYVRALERLRDTLEHVSGPEKET